MPNIAVETVPASFMIWIELNAKIAPFDNVDVRRAMNFAFPQQEVIKAIYQDLASPLNGCMPNIYPGFAGDYFTYGHDLDKAKQLLEKAGQGGRLQDHARLQRWRPGAGADRDHLPVGAARASASSWN